MKRILIIFPAAAILSACNNSGERTSGTQTPAEEKKSYFPVTSYIKGQLFRITEKGVNPLKYTTVNNRTDSAWVRTEDFDKEFGEFLSPVIDSTNLVELYTQNKFVDRSYNNAVTFTYEPAKTLPDSMTLSNWSVYVDPKTGSVNRVYMVKHKGDKELQLTWQNDKQCTIVTIGETEGVSKVEKEERIVWDF